jgi:hypothetical protein
MKRVPEFWEWLEFMGNKDIVKIPIEIYEEIMEGNDGLASWAKKINIQSALSLKEDTDVTLVSRIIDDGYANNLTEDEVEKLGRDPFLIAYALTNKMNRCIVTTEASKPSKIRANRHIPDVCDYFDISWCNTYRFIDELNFITNWKIF